MGDENLTFQQLPDFNRAIGLAVEANNAYSERLTTAKALADIIGAIRLEISRDSPNRQEQKELIRHRLEAEADFKRLNEYFHIYYEAAEALMPPRAAFEVRGS